VQPPGVVAWGVGGVPVEPGGLPNALGRISGEAAGFFGAAQDAFDVDLCAETYDVGGSVSLSLAWLKVGSGVAVSGSVNAFARESQTGSRPSV
jgi:hypothetical protein